MTCEMLRKKNGVQIALSDHLKQVRWCQSPYEAYLLFIVDRDSTMDSKVIFSSITVSKSANTKDTFCFKLMTQAHLHIFN